ncbi:unnamed protein product [Phytomonas sp. EM1]|nr:unnamed protein product [Phytomonas sp. EM1]|eukprot:CCW59621.1 unnamed protein product [Phytomonas sp. isolate EM1]
MSGASPEQHVIAARSHEVHVNFSNDELELPHAAIAVASDSGGAPRMSRRIHFVDDGKLFEGHLTVQPRSLKLIIQHLLDHAAEQAVVVRDLQDQVSNLQSRVVKMNRVTFSSLPGGKSQPDPVSASEDVEKRLKLLEGFMQLWGAQPKEVLELIESHGDPVLIPNQYTSYLLDLPAFRTTRREARTFAVTAAASKPSGVANPSLASAVGSTGLLPQLSSRSRSASRRRGGDEDAFAAATPTPAGGVEKSDAIATRAIETATEALQRLQELEVQFYAQAKSLPEGGGVVGGGGGGGEEHFGSSRIAPPPRPERPGAHPVVDLQARQYIEEVGEYVTRRFEELEARLERGVGSTAGNATRSRGVRGEAPVPAGEGKCPRLQPQALAPNASTLPLLSGPPKEAFGDAGEREDGNASLESVERLERGVEKRFREINTIIQNLIAHVMANTQENQKATTGSFSPQHDSQPNEEGEGGTTTILGRRKHRPSPGGRQENAKTERTPAGNTSGATDLWSSRTNVNTPFPMTAGNPNTAMMPFSRSTPTLADKGVREDMVVLQDRVCELEESFAKRWQSFEERLRIIGRASMNRPTPVSTSSIDRKIREDVSTSLMRIQHLSRDVMTLQRRLDLLTGAAPNTHAGLNEGFTFSHDDKTDRTLHEDAPNPFVETLRDNYITQIDSMEKEVQERITKVNRAIALLNNGAPNGGSANRALEGNLDGAAAERLLHAAAENGVTPALASHSGGARPPSCIVLHSTEEGDEAGESQPMSFVRPSNSGSKAASEWLRFSNAKPNAYLSSTRMVGSYPTGVGIDKSGGTASRALASHRLRPPDAAIFGNSLVSRDATVMGSSTTGKALDGVDSISATKTRSPTTSPPMDGISGVRIGAAAQDVIENAGFVASSADAWEGRSMTNLPILMSSPFVHTKPCVVLNCVWCAQEVS